MTTPATILAAATQAGVNLSVRAGTVYAAPPGRLSAELLDEIRAHKSELVAALAPPSCTSCGATVADPQDVLCAACYQARRGPGRVLAFDPDRRWRTEARLAGRACGTCAGTAWRVNARGDATCGRCFPDSSSTRSGSAPDAPAASKLAGPDRGGVSGGGAA